MTAKCILVLASNYGLWAEELQAPWDALTGAGHALTLATRLGKKPLPILVSMDPDFVDPMQNVKVNTAGVVRRTKELLDGPAWASPVKISDAKMSGFDGLVIVGGPGASLDLVGNPNVHRLVLDAVKAGKLVGALCYGVGALAFTRDPGNKNKSVIFGKTVVAHPHEWDFTFDMNYPLYGASGDNPGTDITSTGFLFPLQHMVEDAVGPAGRVISDATTSREKPSTAVDRPFVTGLSVESSIAFGAAVVDALSKW
jgi:putative intracellular protease/amidase